MIQHTPECLARQQVRADYEAKWPRYCRSCGGRGGRVFYDSHGFKHGPSEILTKPCAACTEQGKCPRCGEPGLISEAHGDDTGDGPCKVCGWIEEHGGAPDVECFCDFETTPASEE